MALQSLSPSTLTLKPYHHNHHRHYPLLLTKPKLAVKSQKLTTEPTGEPTPLKKQTSPAQGFGSSTSSPPSSAASSSKASPSKSNVSGTKKKKGKRERASIIRRSPVETRAAFISQVDEAKAKERNRNESAFLLAWLGLGGIILVEGIVLAASGFLPEEWDKFFVKYLYPSFTPTVFLFVAGTAAYGVLKYLQNEKLKK